MNIMLMMICTIVILPIAVRILTFGKKKKVVMSYMGGSDYGNDRSFVDAFGEKKQMYLANRVYSNYTQTPNQAHL